MSARDEDDVFDEFKKMQDEMDSIFNRFFQGSDGRPARQTKRGRAVVDINQDKDHIYVTTELHGATKNDINVNVSINRVEIRSVVRDNAGNIIEHPFRGVTLPVRVKEKSSQASFKNGVLEIKLLKLKPSKVIVGDK